MLKKLLNNIKDAMDGKVWVYHLMEVMESQKV